MLLLWYHSIRYRRSDIAVEDRNNGTCINTPYAHLHIIALIFSYQSQTLNYQLQRIYPKYQVQHPTSYGDIHVGIRRTPTNCLHIIEAYYWTMPRSSSSQNSRRKLILICRSAHCTPIGRSTTPGQAPFVSTLNSLIRPTTGYFRVRLDLAADSMLTYWIDWPEIPFLVESLSCWSQ